MKVEKEIQIVMSKVENLSNGQLHFREDLERLLTYSLENEKLSHLEELSFHAKFASSLLKIIQKKDDTIDNEYFIKATDEYQKSIIKIKSLLEELIEKGNGFIKSIFENKYLQLTQQSLSNLNFLCSDLSYLKLYFNDLKTSSGNK